MAILARDLALLPLAVLAATFGVMGSAPNAEAAFAKDIVDANSGEELGHILFPDVSGSSAEGVEFNLSGFTQADITSISFSLDPATLDVESLAVSAFMGTTPCTPADGPCSNSTLTLRPQELTIGTVSCPPPPPPGQGGFCSGSASFRFIELIDGAPAFACVGFEPPLAHGPVMVNRNRALPLKAALLDQDGVPVTDADLTAVPVVQVVFDAGTEATAEDVSDQALWGGEGDDGNEFVFRFDKWHFRLKVGQFTAPGTYTITMASGNEAEYRVDPTCQGQFVIRK